MLCSRVISLSHASKESSTRIIDPGNSRENQFDFSRSAIRNDFLFLVLLLKHDIEKRNSRSRHEARDWKKNVSFSS